MVDIEKIKYKYEYFNPTALKDGHKTITEIYSDGTIHVSYYEGNSRKRISKDIYFSSKEEFTLLCIEIMNCIETADRLERYVCDANAEVTIYHQFLRIETMNHGLGNENTTVGRIIEQFIASHNISSR